MAKWLPEKLYFEGTIGPLGTFCSRLPYRDEGRSVDWIYVSSDGTVYPDGDIRHVEDDDNGALKTLASQNLTWYPLKQEEVP